MLISKKNIVLFFMALVILVLLLIYPIFDISLPENVLAMFTSIIMYLIGLITSVEGDTNE